MESMRTVNASLIGLRVLSEAIRSAETETVTKPEYAEVLRELTDIMAAAVQATNDILTKPIMNHALNVFWKLPQELQDMIWESTLPGHRVLEILACPVPRNQKDFSVHQLPIAFQVCRRSRHIALLQYKGRIQRKDAATAFPFNPELDTICLLWQDFGHATMDHHDQAALMLDSHAWRGTTFEHIQHLALDLRYIWDVEDQWVGHISGFLPSACPNLKTLTYVAHGIAHEHWPQCNRAWEKLTAAELVGTVNNARLEDAYEDIVRHFTFMERKLRPGLSSEEASDMTERYLAKMHFGVKLCMRDGALCCDSEGYGPT